MEGGGNPLLLVFKARYYPSSSAMLKSMTTQKSNSDLIEFLFSLFLTHSSLLFFLFFFFFLSIYAHACVVLCLCSSAYVCARLLMRMYVCLFVRAHLFMNMFVCLSLPTFVTLTQTVFSYSPVHTCKHQWSYVHPREDDPPQWNQTKSHQCATPVSMTPTTCLCLTSDHTHHPNAHLSVRRWGLLGMMGSGMSRQ